MKESVASVVDVVIVGAGAAGMMCALEAGKRGRSVVLLDHATKLAEKIRISGGGRCNFTNRHARPEHFLSGNPHFCRSALARFTPDDFIGLLKKHGVRYHEKKLGQLFCDDSSQQIIDLLRDECDAAGVTWQMPSIVQEIVHTHESHLTSYPHSRFTVTTDRNILMAQALVIATGGLSIPQIGASDFGYRIARQFGIPVTSLRPGLVGLTFAQEMFSGFKAVAGIAMDTEVSCAGKSFCENCLLTHRGLSGPAILQISSYWKPDMAIHINLLPQQQLATLLQRYGKSNQLLSNLLTGYLPRRFVKLWCDNLLTQLGLTDKPVKQYQDGELLQIAEHLHDWSIMPSGTAGYKKAEVTVGGVDTHALSSKTMEARQVPGLYFIGEVVDVTGQLGGFNFQWAWSSGYAAGQAV